MAALWTMAPIGASARQAYPDHVPSGSVNGCINCHVSAPNLKNFNPFGHLVRQTLVDDRPHWAAVCAADSDEDGYSNGLELGDPDCAWVAMMPAPTGQTVTLPGDPTSAPGPVAPLEPELELKPDAAPMETPEAEAVLEEAATRGDAYEVSQPPPVGPSGGCLYSPSSSGWVWGIGLPWLLAWKRRAGAAGS